MPANFPSSPTLNQTYSYNGSTWSWTGSYWRLETSQAMSGIAFTYGNAAPSSPNVGDRWIDTTTMLELVYVYDGNSYQWVELSSQAPSTNLAAVSTSITPTANVAYDLGSNTNRWRDLYLSGNSLIIGGATITATGSAIALPSGTTVGGQNVASGGDVATGGGPKITNLQITDNSWTVLDDTAVDTAGGYVLITGTNFVSGALVYLNQTPATSVAFVSATTLRVTVPALTAGTYIVYVINPDGGTAIRVPGLTASANPAWQTASALPEQYDGVAITLNLVATEATTYTLTSGSLPPGLSLNTSTGVITGTVSGVTVDTTYTFTVRATDAQLQDSPRTFTVTITVSDAYFKLTTLLLSGSAISANTVIRDSSTNNFNLTVAGDARASNFTPYGTGWSTYFSSTSGLTISGLTPIGSGDLTIETFVYMTTLSGDQHMIQQGTSTTNVLLSWDSTTQKLRFLLRNDSGSNNFDIYSPSVPVLNQWFHFAGTVQGTTGRMWINGNVVTTGTVSGTRSGSQTFVYMGDNGSGGSRPLTGYLSSTRIVVGTAVYTANFSPTTTNLSSVSGTSLLTNQSNRFINLVGNVAATISQGSPRITSFNPFNITNTGVNGSMYFDGTGDYLSAGSNSAFSLGNGSYTVECWVYPSSISQQIYVVNDTTNGSVFYFETTGSAGFTIAPRAGSAIVSGGYSSLITNSWNHVVFVRGSTAANQTSIFVNGTRVANGTDSTNWTITGPCLIGGLTVGSYMMTGYLSNTRIVKGSAVYDPTQTTLTVPTSPLTAIANTQLLTLQYDQPPNNHTFLDSSSNQFLITRSGNATQGTFSPFSQAGWSNYFSGPTPGTSYLTLSSNVLSAVDVTTGLDTTYEFWVYPTSVTAVQANGYNESSIWSKGTIYAACIINSSGIIRHYTYTGTENYTSTPANSAPLNTWTHVAVVLTNNTVKIFINGQLSVTGTRYAAQLTGQAFKIGAGNVTGSYPSTFFGGYISNFRIVTSALYSANFSPATTSLTAVPNTSLLICQNNRFVDNSTNAFAITASGSPQVQAFSPFAPTAVYNPVVHGGSAYVNATSTYLALPASTPLVNISDWTVDFWMYPTSYINAQGIFGASNGGGASLKIAFQINGSNITLFKTGTGVISISQPPLNQWTHLSVVRSSSTGLAYIFVNGVLGTSGSFGSEAVTSNFQLFTNGEGATSGMYGYLSSFRVSNIARQITAFTVPTQPYQADTNTILLTNFTDTAILDSTGRTVIETVADARSTSVVTKFTGGATYLDGNDYLISPSTDLCNFGTGDFTVELWVYQLSIGSGSYYHFFSVNAQNTFAFKADSSMYYLYSNSATAVSTSGFAPLLNQWVHLALVRSANTLRIFVNGTERGSASTTTGTNFGSAGRLWMGSASGTTGEYAYGYFQDLRITRGYARYTANFTAPTAPARLK